MINLNPEPEILVNGKITFEEEFEMNILPDNLYRICSSSKFYKMRSKIDFKEYLLKEQITNDKILIN